MFPRRSHHLSSKNKFSRRSHHLLSRTSLVVAPAADRAGRVVQVGGKGGWAPLRPPLYFARVGTAWLAESYLASSPRTAYLVGVFFLWMC